MHLMWIVCLTGAESLVSNMHSKLLYSAVTWVWGVNRNTIRATIFPDILKCVVGNGDDDRKKVTMQTKMRREYKSMFLHRLSTWAHTRANPLTAICLVLFDSFVYMHSCWIRSTLVGQCSWIDCIRSSKSDAHISTYYGRDYGMVWFLFFHCSAVEAWRFYFSHRFSIYFEHVQWKFVVVCLFGWCKYSVLSVRIISHFSSSQWLSRCETTRCRNL